MNDFLACRLVERRHGSSYFLATRFFPKDLQQAVWALYAFFRLPDEIVDQPDVAEVEGLALPEGATAADRLMTWREWWLAAYVAESGKVGGGEEEERMGKERKDLGTHPVLRATAVVFHRYGIDPQLAEDFLVAMVLDTWKSRYETYDELRQYMAGSAAAVGLMMTKVIGYSSPTALSHAAALGEAMQLTNFIRDIGEDIRERGRIYLPLEDLRRFGVSEKDVAEQRLTVEMVKLLKFEIDRARALYAEAEPGIDLLDRRGRTAVRLAARLYAAILDKVEMNAYDVFSQRARTSKWDKFKIVSQVLI